MMYKTDLNRYKTIVFTLVGLFFSVTCQAVLPASSLDSTMTPVEQHGRLAVDGASLVDTNGEVVALRGVSLGWHNWWPRFYNKKTISWMVEDWNIRLVRAAIGVHEDNAYLENPDAALQKLYEVVDAAIAEGIYVIIDWHS